MSLLILYGSETGTAELVAEAIADELSADVYDMSDFAVEDLADTNFVITVCSTYGSGELPTGAEPFADELSQLTPDLSHLRFAVFGLGDTVYDETFNRGGEIVAELLTERGATQVGEHGRHDASSAIKPTDQAREWASRITEHISATE